MCDGYEDLQDSHSNLTPAHVLLKPRQYKLFTEDVHAAARTCMLCSSSAVQQQAAYAVGQLGQVHDGA